MSVITFAPPHDDAVARQAQAIGDLFPSVVVAARAGAEWAWTALHRCVAPPATGYLRAAGAPDPDAEFERLFVEIAGGFSSFGGSESDFKVWVFELAHRQVVEGLGLRHRRPSQADLRVLSRLSEGPVIPASVERQHVKAAAAAAVVGQTASAQHRAAHHKGAHPRAAGGVMAALAAMVVGPIGKVAAGAVLAAAVTSGALATDPLPRQAAAPAIHAPAEDGNDAGTAAVQAGTKHKASRTGVKGSVVGATTAPAAKGAPAEKGKAAGLATASAAPDQAGEHKDDGLAKASGAPDGARNPEKVRYRSPIAPVHQPSSGQRLPRPGGIQGDVPEPAALAAAGDAVTTVLGD